MDRVRAGFALALVAGSLAGCIGDGGLPTDTTSTNASQQPVANAKIEECVGYSVQAPLDWDVVAQALPEGFEPAPFVPISLGPVTLTEDRAAEGFFEGWRCQEATVGNISLGEVTFVSAKIQVQPPSELAPPEGHASYIPLFVATDAPQLAATFAEWGLAAQTSDPTVEGLGSGPGRAGHVQGNAANTTIETRVAVAQPPGNSSVPREQTRYFLTDPPLFHAEPPQVVGLLDRATRNATIGIGEGHVQITGEGAGQVLGPALAGLGFDTQDERWGETFRYRSVGGIR